MLEYSKDFAGFLAKQATLQSQQFAILHLQLVSFNCGPVYFYSNG